MYISLLFFHVVYYLAPGSVPVGLRSLKIYWSMRWLIEVYVILRKVHVILSRSACATSRSSTHSVEKCACDLPISKRILTGASTHTFRKCALTFQKYALTFQKCTCYFCKRVHTFWEVCVLLTKVNVDFLKVCVLLSEVRVLLLPAVRVNTFSESSRSRPLTCESSTHPSRKSTFDFCK